MRSNPVGRASRDRWGLGRKTSTTSRPSASKRSSAKTGRYLWNAQNNSIADPSTAKSGKKYLAPFIDSDLASGYIVMDLLSEMWKVPAPFVDITTKKLSMQLCRTCSPDNSSALHVTYKHIVMLFLHHSFTQFSLSLRVIRTCYKWRRGCCWSRTTGRSMSRQRSPRIRRSLACSIPLPSIFWSANTARIWGLKVYSLSITLDV